MKFIKQWYKKLLQKRYEKRMKKFEERLNMEIPPILVISEKRRINPNENVILSYPEEMQKE